MLATTRLLRFIVPASALLALTPSAHAADEYKINLAPPDHVGDAYHLTVSVQTKSTFTTTPGGQSTVSPDGLDAHLVGVATVTAVGPESHLATIVSVKIEKFTDKGKDLAAPGSILVADATRGTAKYTVDGVPVTDARITDGLDSLVSLTIPGHPTTQESMGTATPVKVGDSWDINFQALAKAMAAYPFPVSPAEIQGKCKLADVSTQNGIKFETLTADVHWAADKKTLADGRELHDLRMDSTGSIVIPFDPSIPQGHQTVDALMAFTLGGPGPTVESTIERHVDRETSPVKPAP